MGPLFQSAYFCLCLSVITSSKFIMLIIIKARRFSSALEFLWADSKWFFASSWETLAQVVCKFAPHEASALWPTAKKGLTPTHSGTFPNRPCAHKLPKLIFGSTFTDDEMWNGGRRKFSVGKHVNNFPLCNV